MLESPFMSDFKSDGEKIHGTVSSMKSRYSADSIRSDINSMVLVMQALHTHAHML